jgi:acyl-CoA reductase-like NAD-dependent aldehyde dehydrogenase
MVHLQAPPEIEEPMGLFPTTLEAADQIARQLADRKHDWARVEIPQRISYLQQCLSQVTTIAADWVAAACQAKGLSPEDRLAGEEWILGPAALGWNLRSLIASLEANGQPRPQRLQIRQDQTIAQVFPDNWMDQLLWLGYRGEVWLEPGQPTSQGRIYRQANAQGSMALVLGAGNVSAIAPMDSLYKLFAENQVVLLKMNPVNQYLGPFLEQVFQPLRQAGFLAIVYGGVELGRFLCQHPLIDTIHMTGSHRTHDAILWGSSPVEQMHRKTENRPLLDKPITSELGCVTPVLVVPGQWSQSDLEFQARHVAGMVVHNASFNCCAGKVLVTARDWPQRQAFLDCLHRELARVPARHPYYPGAVERYQAFLERYPQAQVWVAEEPEKECPTVPWTVIPDVPPHREEYALSEEAFCGVLAEVSLAGADAPSFLEQAVAFANQQVWGNLSCTVLIDPATQNQYSDQLETAIAALRYGVIGINVWSGAMFLPPALAWGAFPGNPAQEIQSGQGVVHNTYLFDHPQKSVLRAPFRIFPLPLWFSRHRTLRQVGQRFTAFAAQPTWGNLLATAIAAIRA